MWEYVYTNELYHHGIKGQKWGVRRYQNANGTLTSAGKKRYDRDQRENAGKKKGNKVGQADPNRWVKEDLERTRNLSNSTSNTLRDIDNMNRTTQKISSRKKQSKIDLSKMSDKEMRDAINRYYLERQYKDVMTSQNVTKGREYVSDTTAILTTTLGIASSALGIALAIKELRG